jgi:hypothetical protein
VPKVHVSAYEEKPVGQENHGQISENSPMGQEQEQGESGSRTIYVNTPLPPSAKTEEGRIKAQYARNKIRTAKYTPLSFVPKNLWFQLHNIANVYFIFIVILGVSTPTLWGAFNPLTCLDLLYIRRNESWSFRRTYHLYSYRDWYQRRRGRLAPDSAGHRAQQLSGVSTRGLGQCKFFRRGHITMETCQEDVHSSIDIDLPSIERTDRKEVQTVRKGCGWVLS